MCASTELDAVAELDDTHTVAVLFSEEGHGTEFLSLGNGHGTVLFEGYGVADVDVDLLFHFADFLTGELGKVREVEAQSLVIDAGAFLFHVFAENVAQRFVQEVSRGVVALDGKAAAFIHFGLVGLVEMLGQLGYDVYDEIVLFLGVYDGNHVAGRVGEGALVAHLSTAFAVERCAVKNELVELFVFHLYMAVAGDVHFGSEAVVADEFLGGAGDELDPVVVLYSCCSTGTVLLLGKTLLESLHVHSPAFFSGHKLCEVDGEAVGVEKLECKSPVDGLGIAGVAADIVVEAFDTACESLEE